MKTKTTAKQRVILIELNELCPHLLERWMKQGLLPNFSAFYEKSEVFVTEADVTDPQYLEPWIQWYSVHTGLHYGQHKVFHLTDGPKAVHRDIWQILTENGKAVWNCSSMNAKALAKPGSAFLPDPWCISESPYPAEMRDFYRFVSWNVQEYTNKDQALGFADYFRFISFMATHGLSASTVFAISKQLLSEFTTNKATHWKRAALLDKLQFDVFRHFLSKTRADFSTFFCNSTAHFQHSYWRHMDPDAFLVKPSPGERDKYKDAILFGYQQMDRLMGEFIKLEGDDFLLIFATALSQQPNLKNEEIGGQHFYRPRNVEEMLRTLGIRYTGVEPVMTHQYLIRFADAALKDEAYSKLNSLTWNGESVFGFSDAEHNSIYMGSQVKQSVPEDAKIEFAGANHSVAFYDLLYQIPETKSGRHHPNGVLWLKTGRHRVHDKVSILDIHPTLLDLFNISPESASPTPYPGKSLLPVLA